MQLAVRVISPQPNLVDQVYDAILEEVTAGRFGADSRLIQEELAESLGVSRQPVQQALLLLRDHGLLQDAPGRGLMVAPLDPDHVRNLFEVRGVLDGLASAKVAEIAADAARKNGPAYIARGRAAVESGSIARMTAADMEFHFFLYELSGNPLIAEISAPRHSKVCAMASSCRHLRRPAGSLLLLEMLGVLAQPRAVLHEPVLDPLGHAALGVDVGAVVEVARLAALQPEKLACPGLLLCHDGNLC